MRASGANAFEKTIAGERARVNKKTISCKRVINVEKSNASERASKKKKPIYFERLNHQNREWLYQMYWKEGLTQWEIACFCGTKRREISRWMKRLEIPTRSRSEIAKALRKTAAYDSIIWPPCPPWNKGLGRTRKDIHSRARLNIGYFYHSSSSTKFKRGNRPWNWLPVGSIRIRVHEKGRKNRWIKIAEPNIWESYPRYLWKQKTDRKIPRGFKIYHDDRNSLNDAPRNLVCLPRSLYFKWLRGDIKNFELRRIRGIKKSYKRRKETRLLEETKSFHEEIMSTGG